MQRVLLLLLLPACSGGTQRPQAPAPGGVPADAAPDAQPPDAGAPDALPDAPPPPGPFTLRAPPMGVGDGADLPLARARVLALSDTQLHYLYGKRTFARSPWADRVLALEVAIRPAALDDGADLLLEQFLSERRRRYPDHSLVYLGDASDLSCEQEMDRFTRILEGAGEVPLLMVASNHDGFYAGTYTQKADADGALVLTDMPHDWTRGCAEPGRLRDYRLTKGRATRRIQRLIPRGPRWATHYSAAGRDDPSGYKKAWLAYARPLGGGDPDAPPAWGGFLDTVDYRGFDLSAEEGGAGTTGAVSAEQLAWLDKALFEADIAARGPRPVWVLFGHHTIDDLEPDSRRRFLRFLDTHPQVLAYVSAHTHRSDEKRVRLPSGRLFPELITGSTTDYPQAGRLLEIRYDPDSSKSGLATWRLELDVPALCEGIPPLAPDSLGYIGYRVSRDDTPDVEIGFFSKVAIGVGLSELSSERVAQSAGALLVENDLVRSLARLYRDAPGGVTPEQAKKLDAILERRFPVGDRLADLEPFLSGRVSPGEMTAYDRWMDPVLFPVVSRLARALHTFGAHHALFEDLRASRKDTPERERYFACHAARAAEAEARRPRGHRRGVYVP